MFNKREYQKEYFKKNKERIKRKQNEWINKNKDEINRKARKYYKENNKKMREVKRIAGSNYRKTTKGNLISKLSDIKIRCYSKNCFHYKNYGGRGIKVCDEWLVGTDNFIKWARENGFKLGLEIDRIDNNGNYSPSNCRFVTRKENCRNTRKNVTDFINKTRICRVCKQKKIISLFNKDKTEALGIRYICRECSKIANKIYKLNKKL